MLRSLRSDMRLWSLHPQYLDPQGLVALWREALLAQAVLYGITQGYRHHPQLERFKQSAAPEAAIVQYLQAVHAQACQRGYSFDSGKIRIPNNDGATARLRLTVTSGQMAYEWRHLLAKLKARSPVWYEQWQTVTVPQPHPLLEVQPGDTESWERH